MLGMLDPHWLAGLLKIKRSMLRMSLHPHSNTQVTFASSICPAGIRKTAHLPSSFCSAAPGRPSLHLLLLKRLSVYSSLSLDIGMSGNLVLVMGCATASIMSPISGSVQPYLI